VTLGKREVKKYLYTGSTLLCAKYPMARERAHCIFAELSDDLARKTANLFNRVLCPLCLQAYSEDVIDLEEPELTEEHIIPESLGGKLVTLSCKSSNSTHGSKLDSHLVQMMRSQDSLAGSGTLPLKGRIGSVETNCRPNSTLVIVNSE